MNSISFQHIFISATVHVLLEFFSVIAQEQWPNLPGANARLLPKQGSQASGNIPSMLTALPAAYYAS